MRVFAMMSDSDIEPFTSGQDDDECLPQPEDPSTESDSDGNSSSSSSPPTATPGVMSIKRFFTKRPLDRSKTSRDGSYDAKKQRNQETGRPQKRHTLAISSRSKRGVDFSPAGGSTSTPRRVQSGASRSTPRRVQSGGTSNSHLSTTDDETSVAPPLPTTPTSSLAVSSLETDQSVKSALKEITSLLNNVVERVERVESELKRNTSLSSSSESSPSHHSKKLYMPTIVRVSSVLQLCLLLCCA